MKDASFDAIVERLQEAAGVKSLAALAPILGISTQAMYEAKRRGKVPEKWVTLISTKFSKDMNWLLCKDVSRAEDHAPKLGQDSGEFVEIPCVEARLAAGGGSFETSAHKTATYSFRADWLRHKGGDPKNMVLMHVSGDSMEPRFEDGDIVLIDQGRTDILAFNVYAVGIEDAVYIKEILTEPGKLILSSYNPKYRPIEVDLTAEQPDNVRIIGRVLWLGRNV